MERLQKILSAAGVCSRRKAEELIQAGRITVNGKTASLGDRADWDRDDVRLDGRALAAPAERRCLMLNKPRGYVTTLADERGRPTVAELVADCGVRVYPVGRLDMDSQGLLLLTNDGALAHRLAHPSHGMEKEYRVTVSGRLEGCAERLSALRKLEDGSPIAPARAAALLREPGRWVLSVTIRQGLNRQVRRMCAMAGLRVHRLERVREGPLTLGDLPPGCWRPLTAAEVSALSAQP
ncbi:MAG: rRNA pseudouridine synthase [Oscillospiraceae bacterium]|nr:rRNA pseudouridine synthase [Oscillospiraceae bacterium]